MAAVSEDGPSGFAVAIGETSTAVIIQRMKCIAQGSRWTDVVKL